MNQLTLRKIPDTVEKQLRVHARKSGRSLNKTAVALLSRALGADEPSARRSERKRDLSSFLGTLGKNDLKEFESNTSDFSRIDPGMWKS